MVAEYIGKIIKAFDEKPETMMAIGIALMIGFAMISWTYPMYVGGAIALVGYLKSKKGKKKGK